MIAVWISLYVAVAIVALLTFHKYGEKIGLVDYDKQVKDYSTMDEWETNESAYLFFALIWPMPLVVFSLRGIYLLFLKFSKYIKNKTNKKEL